MDWDLVGWVKSSSVRREVLGLLIRAPTSPKDISKALNLHLPQVSMVLKDMSERGLVECLNKGARKGKLFVATSRGKEIIELINSMKRALDS